MPKSENRKKAESPNPEQVVASSPVHRDPMPRNSFMQAAGKTGS